MLDPTKREHKAPNIDNEDYAGDSDCEAFCRLTQEMSANADSDSDVSVTSPDSSSGVSVGPAVEVIWTETSLCPSDEYPEGTRYLVTFSATQPGCFVNPSHLAVNKDDDSIVVYRFKNKERAFLKWRNGCLNGQVPYTKQISPLSIFLRVVHSTRKAEYDDVVSQRLNVAGKGKGRETDQSSSHGSAAALAAAQSPLSVENTSFRSTDTTTTSATGFPNLTGQQPLRIPELPHARRLNGGAHSFRASPSTGFRSDTDQSFRNSGGSVDPLNNVHLNRHCARGAALVDNGQHVDKQESSPARATSGPPTSPAGCIVVCNNVGPNIISKLLRDKRQVSLEPTTPRKVAKIAHNTAASRNTSAPPCVSDFPKARVDVPGRTASAAAAVAAACPACPGTPTAANVHVAAAIPAYVHVHAANNDVSANVHAVDAAAADDASGNASAHAAADDDVSSHSSLPSLVSTPCASPRATASISSRLATVGEDSEEIERNWAGSTTADITRSSGDSIVSSFSVVSGASMSTSNFSDTSNSNASARNRTPSLTEFGAERAQDQPKHQSSLQTPEADSYSLLSDLRWVVMAGYRTGIYYNARNADDAAGGRDGARVCVYKDMETASRVYANGVISGEVIQL